MIIHDGFTTWARLAILAVPVLLIGVLLAVSIVLIAVPSTRKAGWILLSVFIGVPLVAIPVVVLFWARQSRFAEEASMLPHNNPVMRQLDPPASNSPTPSGDATIPLPPAYTNPPQQSAPATAATPPAEKQPIDKQLTAESAKLIDVLSKVLAKTIIEDPKAWQDLAAKATKQMEQPAEKAGSVVEATAEKQLSAETTPSPKPPKPDWVGRQAWFVAGDSHYERDIEVDPFPTLVESEAKLPATLQKALDEYVELAFTDNKTKLVVPIQHVEKYEEWRHTSQGDMLTLHVLARIDRNQVAEAYQKAVADRAEVEKQFAAKKRLWRFGECFTGGFLLLAAVWGYLKIDLATGGNRRGILRTAALIVILSIAAALALAIVA